MNKLLLQNNVPPSGSSSCSNSCATTMVVATTLIYVRVYEYIQFAIKLQTTYNRQNIQKKKKKETREK